MTYLAGLLPILGRIYRSSLRKYLPRKIGVCNGIPCKKPRLLDTGVIDPNWEENLIRSIRKYVCSGDKVILIGAGYGISTVAAAKEVNNRGEVIAYEPAKERYECAMDTLSINKAEDNVELRNAIVGPPVAVKGEATNAEKVTPSELSECNILVLDCEGSEKFILDDMEITPRTIIVETHPDFGSQTSDIISILEKRGYSIISNKSDNPELGIDIVCARFDSGRTVL